MPVHGYWRGLRSQVTVRTNGTSGIVVGTLFIVLDNLGMPAFFGDSQTATLNTTASLTIDFRANIDNATDAEAVHCDQVAIRLE
jgi:hypothetical protein